VTRKNAVSRKSELPPLVNNAELPLEGKLREVLVSQTELGAAPRPRMHGCVGSLIDGSIGRLVESENENGLDSSRRVMHLLTSPESPEPRGLRARAPGGRPR
jgi:hypothetical protein